MYETSFFNKNSFHIVKPGYDRWKKRKENDKKKIVDIIAKFRQRLNMFPVLS